MYPLTPFDFLIIISSVITYSLTLYYLKCLGCILQDQDLFTVMLFTHFFFLCRHCLLLMELIAPSRNMMKKNDHFPCWIPFHYREGDQVCLKLTITTIKSDINYKGLILYENINFIFWNFCFYGGVLIFWWIYSCKIFGRLVVMF